MSSDDWLSVIARFETARTINHALDSYPSKSVIVFCRHRDSVDLINWLIVNHSVKDVSHRNNKVTLCDGRTIVFIGDYNKSRGYERNKFVAVNYI